MVQFADKESLFSSPGLVVVCHYINFFCSQKKFRKKRVIVVIGVLHNMKVKCDLLRRKKYFSRCKNSRFVFFDASHRRAIWHEGEASRRQCLARQSDSRLSKKKLKNNIHIEHMLLFSSCRLHHQAAVFFSNLCSKSYWSTCHLGRYLACLRQGWAALPWNDLWVMRNFQQQPKRRLNDEREPRRNKCPSFWKFLESESSL